MAHTILTDALIEEIVEDVEHHGDWLILHESDEFPGYWEVEGLDPEFFWDFEDVLGRYRIVSPVRLEAFLAQVAEKNYRVAWETDPEPLLAAHQRLKELPDISLNSDLENTVQGFLPWQIIGYNKFIQAEDIPALIACWDTGAGKTALEAAAIRHYLDAGAIDLAVVCVKAHNKIDTQRKLKSLADIESLVIDGSTQLKRYERYGQVEEALATGQPTVLITNYEKFREDRGVLDHFLKKRRVLFCWDEMPAKLSSRTTQLYEGVKRALYKSFISKPNPLWMRHLVLSATPLENDPDGVYSWLNLVRPYFLGTVTQFHAEHVVSRNYISGRPEAWRDLDKVEARLDHMMHRVSKDDPDVAKMFPSVIRDVRVIDWHPAHRAIYDQFTDKAETLLKEEDAGVNMLSLIQVFQMLCDAPSMVKASAENRAAFSALVESWGDLEGEDVAIKVPTGSQAALELLKTLGGAKLDDRGHTKHDAMREIIVEKHPHEKVVVHSTWANYIFPVWNILFTDWQIPFVFYAGTDKQKQMALDRFREDPDLRVFLSGDAGADSIDIAEASVGINYNGPWKWTTEKQREGRRDRVNSKFKTIYTYTLMMADSVEDRKRAVRDQKFGYHSALFEGRAVEGALSARLTADDLRFMLFGDPDD